MSRTGQVKPICKAINNWQIEFGYTEFPIDIKFPIKYCSFMSGCMLHVIWRWKTFIELLADNGRCVLYQQQQKSLQHNSKVWITKVNMIVYHWHSCRKVDHIEWAELWLWLWILSCFIFSQTQCGSWVEHIWWVERTQRESWGIQVLPTRIRPIAFYS